MNTNQTNQGHQHINQPPSIPSSNITNREYTQYEGLYKIIQIKPSSNNIEYSHQDQQGAQPNQKFCFSPQMTDKFSIELANSGNTHPMQSEDKRQKTPDHQKNVEIRCASPKGLQNIGNSCFLNSVIQFLFSAHQFKRMLIQKYEKCKRNSFQQSSSALLGAIFYHLEFYPNQHKDIRKLLEKFLSCLQKLNKNYQRYSQEDAFITLNNLLCNLDYTQSQFIKIKQLFEIEYESKCACLSEWIVRSTMYANTEPQSCSSCKEQFQTKTIYFPKYMIISRYNLPLRRFNKQGKQYDLKCNLRYYGNGQSGHYNVQIYKGCQRYSINDNQVSHEILQYPISKNPCSCLLPLCCCMNYFCLLPIFCGCWKIQIIDGCDKNAHFSLLEKVIPKGSQTQKEAGCICKYDGMFHKMISNICSFSLQQNEVISSLSWCFIPCCNFGITESNSNQL